MKSTSKSRRSAIKQYLPNGKDSSHLKLKQFTSLEHSATTFGDNEEIHFSFERDSDNKNDGSSAFDQIQNTDKMKTANIESSQGTSSSSEDHFESKNHFIKKASCKTEIIENTPCILQEKDQSNIHNFEQSISKTSGRKQSNELMYIRLFITLHNGDISKTFSRVE